MRRYDGNTGKYIYIPDHGATAAAPPPPRPAAEQKDTPPPMQLGSGVQKFLGNLFRQGFEREDLLLFAVLFLLYQETGDKELLIIMGGMFLL